MHDSQGRQGASAGLTGARRASRVAAPRHRWPADAGPRAVPGAAAVSRRRSRMSSDTGAGAARTGRGAPSAACRGRHRRHSHMQSAGSVVCGTHIDESGARGVRLVVGVE